METCNEVDRREEYIHMPVILCTIAQVRIMSFPSCYNRSELT